MRGTPLQSRPHLYGPRHLARPHAISLHRPMHAHTSSLHGPCKDPSDAAPRSPALPPTCVMRMCVSCGAERSRLVSRTCARSAARAAACRAPTGASAPRWRRSTGSGSGRQRENTSLACALDRVATEISSPSAPRGGSPPSGASLGVFCSAACRARHHSGRRLTPCGGARVLGAAGRGFGSGPSAWHRAGPQGDCIVVAVGARRRQGHPGFSARQAAPPPHAGPHSSLPPTRAPGGWRRWIGCRL